MRKGGRYIIRNGKRVLVERTSPPPDYGIHDEHVTAHANFLAMRATDALRALEYRLEQLAPGITDDPDAVLSEPGGRWKHESFPRVGLALLFRMMQTGSQDLEGTASAWRLYQDAMRAGRDEHQDRYRTREPLRLALWEHGCARHWRFPPPSGSSDDIKDAFEDLLYFRVTHFGQDTLNAPGRQAVSSRHERPERTLLLANCFYELWSSDPEWYSSSTHGLGFSRAADIINDRIRHWQSNPERYHSEHLTTPQVIRSFTLKKHGGFVTGETIRKSLEHPDSRWQDVKAFGLRGSSRGNKGKK